MALPSIDLLATPTEITGRDRPTAPPLRTTWLLKPGFHVVPQPLAPPYIPDMAQESELLAMRVSEVTMISRIYWSESPIERGAPTA